MKDLEKQKSRSQEMVLPKHTPRTMPIPRPRDPDNGHGDSMMMSFTSQQRHCPVCSRVFHSLSDKDFQTHVARCFQ